MRSCAIDGCNDQPALITDSDDAWSIAVDASTVYWSQNTGAGQVDRCPLTGACASSTAPIAIDQVNPGGVVVDATNVYWANFANGLIESCPKAGSGCGASPDVLAMETNPVGVAVDATTVYWATQGGDVRACPILGCPEPTTLASGQVDIAGIAADATALYWCGSGAIMKLVK